MLDFSKLARPEIRDLTAYSSARSLTLKGSFFLDANESPISPDPLRPLHRYPEPQPRKLQERFAHLYGVPANQLVIGRGSDEAIDLLIRTFCESGRDAILTCPPSYGVYTVCAAIQGARSLTVPLKIQDSTVGLDEDGLAEALQSHANVKILFVCSPNNPTGTAFSIAALLRLCEMTKDRCLLVLDEAYVEFSESGSMIPYLNQYPQLVILRTLSKAWALAGVRCGVAIAHTELIALLQKVRAPYPLSLPTIQSALEFTDPHYEKLLEERVALLLAERQKLGQELTELVSVAQIFPSSSNFLLVRFHAAQKIFAALKSQGIVIRDRSSDCGLQDCLRISIGSPEENRIFIRKLREISARTTQNGALAYEF